MAKKKEELAITDWISPVKLAKEQKCAPQRIYGFIRNNTVKRIRHNGKSHEVSRSEVLELLNRPKAVPRTDEGGVPPPLKVGTKVEWEAKPGKKVQRIVMDAGEHLTTFDDDVSGSNEVVTQFIQQGRITVLPEE